MMISCSKLRSAKCKNLIGLQGEPDFVRVVRWNNAMPQYNVGHIDRVRRIENAIAPLKSLSLISNSLHGVGIAPVIASAEKVAKTIVGRLEAFFSGRYFTLDRHEFEFAEPKMTFQTQAMRRLLLDSRRTPLDEVLTSYTFTQRRSDFLERVVHRHGISKTSAWRRIDRLCESVSRTHSIVRAGAC